MFYCWARDAALCVANRIIESNSLVPEVKVCNAALRLMLQILNWDFRYNNNSTKTSINVFSAGARHDTDSLKRFECTLVQVTSFVCVWSAAGNLKLKMLIGSSYKRLKSGVVILIDSIINSCSPLSYICFPKKKKPTLPV